MSTYIIGVGFNNPKLNYYSIDTEVSIGQGVVVETPLGFELGRVQVIRKSEREDDKDLFVPILRIATFQDEDVHKKNIERGKKITATVQELSDELDLKMSIIQSTLSLDNAKVLITYLAEDRVDFRELLKVLSGQLRCRIELRQIGPRDKARMIGGLGVCGLQLCCSTFLDSFEGISISMAKNQMLSLNIPKLSGQCGKLMCCLKYEDEAYSELKTKYPSVGNKIIIDKKQYTVNGVNVLSGNITLYDGETISTVNAKETKYTLVNNQENRPNNNNKVHDNKK